MRVDSFKYLGCLGFVCLLLLACSSPKSETEQIRQILKVQESSIPANVNQLLVVLGERPENTQVSLFALEKTSEDWKIRIGPLCAGIGRNGFAAYGEKLEGDGKSPSGVFSLGQLFTYADTLNTKMPYTISTDEDKWIDDPESEDYNKHVRGEANAKSFEKLKLKSDYYKYCLVIEYNTHPVVKGKGSAIFIHLREKADETTAGCVAVSERDMEQLIKWLNPDAYPVIVMGDRLTLSRQPVR